MSISRSIKSEKILNYKRAFTLVSLSLFACKDDKSSVISSSSQDTLVSVISSSAMGASVSSPAPSSTHKGILDYYLQLPNDWFVCEHTSEGDYSAELQKAQILLLDEKNGYIRAMYDSDSSTTFEMALFRDPKEGSDLIAVNRSCGDGCMCDRDEILRMDTKGNWHRTLDFPYEQIKRIVQAQGGQNFESYDLRLPRQGTSIRVVDGNGGDKTLLWIDWVNGKFVVRSAGL